jgi:hypothetical protein
MAWFPCASLSRYRCHGRAGGAARGTAARRFVEESRRFVEESRRAAPFCPGPIVGGMRVVREDDAAALAADLLLREARRRPDVDMAQVNALRVLHLCALLLDALGTGRTEEGNG